jgi:meromycolic acid enoyl-[acyl-carrier-protein] reductase
LAATSPCELGAAGLLAGRRVLVTGLITRESIAFGAAEQMQRAGAEVLLTSFGRARSLTERAARSLPAPAEILELDVTLPEHHRALAAELERRRLTIDGALHAVAHAPPDALGGNFLTTPAQSALAAFETSAFSLKALSETLLPVMTRGASIVALDFDDPVAWPMYDWMGVSKAGLRAIVRYLTRDLGPHGVRVNLVSSGPIGTLAARGVPLFGELASSWEARAPLGWDAGDASVVADTICFLLSDLARGIAGEIIHVDGGMHAIGTALQPPTEEAA